ncbi:MAG: hypothetical protein EA403_17375 [Spirochaetaceae bacterium]|nr:MAG: hypothetical protein EA403_17375 [Spirochaetaceae bacterium]
MKRPLVLAPIVYSHDPASPAGEDSVAGAVRELTSRPEFRDGGITWSFPARWWERRDSPLGPTLEAIRERVASGLDALAPCGYSGCHHGALLATELERELGWAIKNPWGSGLRPSFASRPTILFSTRIDLAREQALERYTSTFDVFISGVQRTSTSRLDDLLIYHNQLAHRMAALSVGRTPLRQRTATRRRCSALLATREPVVAVLIPVECAADRGGVSEFLALLDRLPRRRSLRLAAIDEPLILQCDVDHHAVPEIEPAGPQHLSLDAERAARGAGRLRAGRATIEATRSLLVSLADARGSDEDVPQTPVTHPREYIASMMGDAYISDDSMIVSFEGGNLRGIADDEGALLLDEATAGWVETERRRHLFTISSAFSYEAEQCRGLSTMATAAGMAGSTAVRMDASFVEGYPWFVLDVRVDTPPPGPAIRSLTPLVVGLTDCSTGQCLEIETLYPDGEIGHTFLEGGRRDQTVTVWGALFRFRWGDRCLSVGYPALHGKTIAPIAVRMIPQRRGRSRIELHPAGYYAADSPELISARSYRVTFCVAPGEPDEAGILRPPSQLVYSLSPGEEGRDA